MQWRDDELFHPERIVANDDEKKTAKARTEALALMQEVMSSGDKYFLCDFARDMNRLGLWNMRQVKMHGSQVYFF